MGTERRLGKKTAVTVTHMNGRGSVHLKVDLAVKLLSATLCQNKDTFSKE